MKTTLRTARFLAARWGGRGTAAAAYPGRHLCNRSAQQPIDHHHPARHHTAHHSAGTGWSSETAREPAGLDGLSGVGSVDSAEVEKFSRIAAKWWEEDGPQRLLHSMTPPRVSFITQCVQSHCTSVEQSHSPSTPLEGVTALDVGCGAGLLSEALARVGATVVGIDASLANIKAAQAHFEQDIFFPHERLTYEHITAERILQEGRKFDLVVCSEVIEHVTHVDAFLQTLCGLVKDGGCLVISTINRTPASYALAIGMAEYVLKWVPVGTHTWEKFVTPEEVTATLEGCGLSVRDVAGLQYRPLTDAWVFVDSLQLNFLLAATRQKGKAEDGVAASGGGDAHMAHTDGDDPHTDGDAAHHP